MGKRTGRFDDDDNNEGNSTLKTSAMTLPTTAWTLPIRVVSNNLVRGSVLRSKPMSKGSHYIFIVQ